MTHIDDWLDDTNTLEDLKPVKEWFEHFRLPAADQDHDWLAARPLFCTYKDGQRYRCTGCSTMGDVWLTTEFDRVYGYQLRVGIDDCTDWKIEQPLNEGTHEKQHL